MGDLMTNTSFLATGQNFVERLWFTKPASTYAGDQDELFLFIFWICVFFFVLLMGLSVYFVFKYRRIPGKPQERSASHNTPLELTWSVGPLVILAVIFFWGFDRYMNLNVAPANVEEIQVTAFQWGWEMQYDNGAATREFTNLTGTVDSPVFYAPAGRPVKLLMHSRDVIHSFYVPDFRVKYDVFPMRYTTMWFQVDEPGDHYLFCAEYCGKSHSEMAGLIRVVPEDEYRRWKAEMAEDTRPPVEIGKTLFVTKACNSCHSVDGSPNTGPTWLDIYGKEEVVLVNGQPQTITVDENYIRESILEPQVKIVQGYPNQMNSYQGQLSEKEILALISYIKSLSERGRAELEREEAARESEEGEPADAEGAEPSAVEG